MTRTELFRLASNKMRADFEELRQTPHKGLKGQEAEQLVIKFLSDRLPKRFDVGSGHIIDYNDTVSPQLDVIVYDAWNCPLYRVSEINGVFPVANVASIVSVKSVLDKGAIEEAFEVSNSVKEMARSRGVRIESFGAVHGAEGHKEGGKEEFNNTLSVLFAFESSISLVKVQEHYGRLLHERGIGYHLDIIAILDKGIVMMASQPAGHNWGPSIIFGTGGVYSEGSHLGTFAMPLEGDTLDGFYRLLLGHLVAFDSPIDHPGYAWSQLPSDRKSVLQYLGSITHEHDPERAEQIIKQYRDQALSAMESTILTEEQLRDLP